MDQEQTIFGMGGAPISIRNSMNMTIKCSAINPNIKLQTIFKDGKMLLNSNLDNVRNSFIK